MKLGNQIRVLICKKTSVKIVIGTVMVTLTTIITRIRMNRYQIKIVASHIKMNVKLFHLRMITSVTGKIFLMVLLKECIWNLQLANFTRNSQTGTLVTVQNSSKHLQNTIRTTTPDTQPDYAQPLKDPRQLLAQATMTQFNGKGFEDGNEENFTRQRIYHSRDVNKICGIPPFRTLPPVTAKGNITPNKNCASLSDQVWKSSLV
ncbi:hypothetical protein Avbf_07763 [Armadillidium vulgare]|nr:hypothetical protein Avbf_07763 [Armadillidium vulgare]